MPPRRAQGRHRWRNREGDRSAVGDRGAKPRRRTEARRGPAAGRRDEQRIEGTAGGGRLDGSAQAMRVRVRGRCGRARAAADEPTS